MKRGDSFPVESEKERKQAITIGKNFKDAGVVDFKVKTFEDSGVFKVCAIEPTKPKRE